MRSRFIQSPEITKISETEHSLTSTVWSVGFRYAYLQESIIETQDPLYIVKSENMLTLYETTTPSFAGGVSNPAYSQCPSNCGFYYN